MAPTTFTTIVMIAFAIVVLTMACYAWFGSWQPEPRGVRVDDDGDVTAEVERFRRAIEDYERGDRAA